MRILVLSNNPSRASFRQRLGIYLDFLRSKGFQVDVVRFAKSYWARWRCFVRAGNYDLVLLHKKTLNAIDARVLRAKAKCIVYDFDDAVMTDPNRPSRDRSSHGRLFKRTVKLADHIVAGNEHLAECARKYNDCVSVIPTGLVLDEFLSCRTGPRDGKIRLVWIGSKATLKYLEEIKPALEQIGSKFKNVSLRIVSDEFFDLANMSVEKILWSKDTQVANLIDSDIGLAPLPDNRYTRGKCGFKILQYFAASLPVVASPVGVNQEFVEKSSAGILADSPDQWIDALTGLIEDEACRLEMGACGRNYVQRFSADVIQSHLLSVLEQVR